MDWQARQLAVMCAVCVATGFLAGYLLRGSAQVATPAPSARAEATAPSPEAMRESAGQLQTHQASQQMPTLDDLKRMADMKAAPLLAKLKSDAKNPQLQNQIGLIYENAHQFKTPPDTSKSRCSTIRRTSECARTTHHVCTTPGMWTERSHNSTSR